MQVCPLCYLELVAKDAELADTWKQLSRLIGVDHIFQISQSEHPDLVALESLGYVLSCDIGAEPTYEICTLYDDLVCINEDHKEALVGVIDGIEAEA